MTYENGLNYINNDKNVFKNGKKYSDDFYFARWNFSSCFTTTIFKKSKTLRFNKSAKIDEWLQIAKKNSLN